VTALVGRLRWTFTDGLTLVGRELGRLRQAPGELVAALIFPAVMVVLFGYVFGSAIHVPGGGDYREYLMPGLCRSGRPAPTPWSACRCWPSW
jgi:ABC-2 type transport system permease protein